MAGGDSEGGKRRLAREKALGTQIAHCGFAAVANHSGGVLLPFICVKGGEKKSLTWSFKKILKQSVKLLFNCDTSVTPI